MPGVKGRSGGKNAKTTAQHKRDGSYRADRHAKRADSSSNLSALRKPAGLSEIQSELWDAVATTLPPGVLGSIDATGMLGLVRWYELYHRTMQTVESNPTDTQAMKQAKTAWDSFWRVASEFGIGPSNRARLKAPVDPGGEDDPFQSLLSRLSGTN